MLTDFCTCRICFATTATVKPNSADHDEVHCIRCGNYSITGTAKAMWEANVPSTRQKVNAAGWLRERSGMTVTSDDIEFLLKVTPPTVADRANKLLQAIAKWFPKTGEVFQIPHGLPQLYEWCGASWSQDEEEVVYLVRGYLTNGMGWLTTVSTNSSLMMITASGYRHLEELQMKPIESKIGFCAMWFDNSVMPVWTDGIEPAIRDAGYTPLRIDGHQHNNRIDDEIIAMIRRSKFIVADFTGQRGGVYFEAGLALGLGLEVVWTCSKQELEAGKIHFDNRQYSFVTWEPEKLNDFKNRLQNRIEATIGLGPN